MSTTRPKELDKKAVNDKKFKQVTEAMITGGNYALSAAGAVSIALSALGLVVVIPGFVFLLIPAAIALVFYGIGVYNHVAVPAKEETVENMLGEIKVEIKEVMDRQAELKQSYTQDKDFKEKEIKKVHFHPAPTDMSIFSSRNTGHAHVVSPDPKKMTLEDESPRLLKVR
ncbi:MAG: hypothetical protein ACYCQI_16925 [Gammaproteobacteria bacterium]